jgi:hypothetical protein
MFLKQMGRRFVQNVFPDTKSCSIAPIGNDAGKDVYLLAKVFKQNGQCIPIKHQIGTRADQRSTASRQLRRTSQTRVFRKVNRPKEPAARLPVRCKLPIPDRSLSISRLSRCLHLLQDPSTARLNPRASVLSMNLNVAKSEWCLNTLTARRDSSTKFCGIDSLPYIE